MKQSVKMSIPQYNAFRKAQEDGDDKTADAIMELGFQEDWNPSLIEATEAEILEEEQEIPNEDILDAVAAGLSNKEIYGKFGISAQKLSVIKKGAK